MRAAALMPALTVLHAGLLSCRMAHVTEVAPALLRGVGLFQGLDEDQLADALSLARLRAYPAGSFFHFQGDVADRAYVLLEGRVRLTQVTSEGEQLVVRFVAPREEFGIIAVLKGIPYPVAAEAIEAAKVLAWDGPGLAELMQRHHPLALNAMNLLACRLVELQERLRDLTTQRVERRIARSLLRLARQSGVAQDGGVLIDLPLTRQDLAEMNGTTLYTVSRTLAAWQNQGLIATQRKRICILLPHALVAIAEDLPPAAEKRSPGA